MPTLHSFLRWSTPEQSLKTSEARQVDRLRGATEATSGPVAGWNFSERYRAPGISGYRGKHRLIGGLKVFLDEVKRGDILQGDALGVENFDRFGREVTTDALDLFREVVRSGVGLFANGILFTETILRQQSGLWHVVIAEMNRAHEELARKGSAVSAANDINRRNAASKSRALHGRNCPRWLLPVRVEPRDPPDWYDGLGDQGTAYHIIPERRDVLHRIIKLALDGFGIRKIAAILNADGVPAWEWRTRKRPENPQWHGDYIGKILRNPALIGQVQPEKVDEKGKFHPEGEVIDPYPRIITEAEFDRLRAALARRRTFSGGRNAGKLPNLVSGLCFCSVCGGRVRYKEQPTRKNGKTYVKEYLVCVGAKEGGCTNKEGFPYRVLEATLTDYPRLSVAIAAMIEQQPTDQGARIAVLEDELAQAQRRRARMMAKFIDADDDDPVAKQMIGDLRAEEKRLDAMLAEVRREQSLRQHDADEDFLMLFYEAKMRLTEWRDPEVVAAARRVLYDQYHQRIERIWLDPGRRLRILLNPTAAGQFEMGLFSARYSRSIRGERTLRMIRENATKNVPLDELELERIERIERHQWPFENYSPETSAV